MFRKISMLFVMAFVVIGTYVSCEHGKSPVEPVVSNDIVLMSGDKPIDVVSIDNVAKAKGKKQNGKLYSLSYGKQDVVAGDNSVQVWIE
ncbi:MAG: hypothetical protein IKP05_03295 [Alphaproteobacteria bacterium]|nr:hypothetical protein [Alphaproteobacteria bacterium]